MNAFRKAESPFRLENRNDLVFLRDILRKRGLTQENLSSYNRLGFIDLAIVKRLTAADSELNALIRLFQIGLPIPVESARKLLAPLKIEDLVATGLLKVDCGHLRSEAAISPVADLYLAHDFRHEFTGEAAPNHVLEAGPSSQTLASLTVRPHVRRMLDLCAGAGIQSMLSASHVDHVVATDINRRALAFAKFNSLLNDIDTIELREGNLFDPVDAEHFDLIVANPPFVISPDARFIYRDSGVAGDTMCETIIRQAHRYLNEGGWFVMMLNWHHRDERDWCERPLEWVLGNGCDVWLMHFGSSSPVVYAARWLRLEDRQEPKALGPLLDAWLEYYRHLGAGMISVGAIVMRRRSGAANWTRADNVPEFGGRSCGDQIMRVFAGEDLLCECANDVELLERAFTLAPDHEMHQVVRAENDGWTIKSASLRQTGGFEFSGSVDLHVTSMLALCNGSRSLRQVFNEMTKRMGIDFDKVASTGPEIVRSLVRHGFLTSTAA